MSLRKDVRLWIATQGCYFVQDWIRFYDIERDSRRHGLQGLRLLDKGRWHDRKKVVCTSNRSGVDTGKVVGDEDLIYYTMDCLHLIHEEMACLHVYFHCAS